MNKLLIVLLAFGLVLFGCPQTERTTIEYACSDGSIVSDPDECVQEEIIPPAETIQPNEKPESEPEEESNQPKEEDAPQRLDDCSHASNGELLALCYEQKYWGPAVEANDPNICADIVAPSYLGLCYAKVANSNRDGTVCNLAEEVEYTATGYYDTITSRELCFYYLVLWEEQNHLNFNGELCEEIENLQMRTECQGLDEKYYEPPENLQIQGVGKVGEELGVQILFEREDRHYLDLDFQETNLNGELTYSITRQLDSKVYSPYYQQYAPCGDCKDEVTASIMKDSMEILRSEFNLYGSSPVWLGYEFHIPLLGANIQSTYLCSGLEGMDIISCRMNCLAIYPSDDEKREECQDDCEEYLEDIECPVQYELEVIVEGEDGTSYSDKGIIPGISE